MAKFRLLRADEIECRVATINAKGLSLLLYKDARCDMNILDETVGEFNWKRSHTRENANCIVSIYDPEKKEWVSKEDTGTESNTEKEKGLASDSFKRACFNWGIGRELYTAPFIWITADKCKIIETAGKYRCNERFNVSGIAYDENRRITSLIVVNGYNQVVFEYGKRVQTSVQPLRQLEKKYLDSLTTAIANSKYNASSVLKTYKVNDLSELTFEQYMDCLKRLT